MVFNATFKQYLSYIVAVNKPYLKGYLIYNNKKKTVYFCYLRTVNFNNKYIQYTRSVCRNDDYWAEDIFAD